MKSLLALAAAALFSVIVNPLGAELARLFSDIGPQNQSAMFMLAPYVAVPLVCFVTVGVVVAYGVPRTPSVTWGLLTGAVSAPVLLLAGQTRVWSHVGEDAQAAIALIFMPIRAVMASGALALGAIFVRWVIGRWRDAVDRPRHG
ncbi:hypothetical protein [Myxococcus sp. CA040A]|uniref:hypothetical protein n=1 Tax=Myxococcus sp. CA040A TaxID=2741738 RepID=UPI00157AEB4E|nr:hypothetical protein [Myxococcus sp. CA040A]NTX00929.1 hypothetical protein [Myxococcus sp. CA040A]